MAGIGLTREQAFDGEREGELLLWPKSVEAALVISPHRPQPRATLSVRGVAARIFIDKYARWMDGSSSQGVLPRRDRLTWGLALLTMANFALYVVAAALHLGMTIPLGFATLHVPEPIPPAVVVEAVIAAGLFAGAVATFRGHRSQRLIRAAYVVALIGTIFGLTIALVRGLRGLDIWIHLLMLAGLAGGFVLLRKQRT